MTRRKKWLNDWSEVGGRTIEKSPQAAIVVHHPPAQRKMKRGIISEEWREGVG